MKQHNSIIASAIISGLIVLSMAGIGANALANGAAPGGGAKVLAPVKVKDV